MSGKNDKPPEQTNAAPEGTAQWDEDDMTIPPRRVLHQPEYVRLTKYFQVGLLSLFLLLTVGMFIWYHWFSH